MIIYFRQKIPWGKGSAGGVTISQSGSSGSSSISKQSCVSVSPISTSWESLSIDVSVTIQRGGCTEALFSVWETEGEFLGSGLTWRWLKLDPELEVVGFGEVAFCWEVLDVPPVCEKLGVPSIIM